MRLAADALSLDETQALAGFGPDGRVSISLYTAGVFSEPAFVLYGIMERLVIRKRLSYLGQTGDQKNAAYHYAFPEHADGQRLRLGLGV
jgi:hypothetical protein